MINSKRLAFVILLAGITLLIIHSTQSAIAFDELPPSSQDLLALVSEETGMTASFVRTSSACRYDQDYQVYLCPPAEPTPQTQPDPAAAARASHLLNTSGLLLIPDSGDDRVMAFDPLTGDLVNPDFIPTDPTHLSTPINAILGPGGDSILVSDQIEDVVLAYDLQGNYLGVFAPAGGPDPSVLDNVRGIALRPNGNLLVTVGGGANADAVAEFDSDGNYLGNFVANGDGGLDSPFDAYQRTADWLVGGSTSDALHRYDLNTGAYIADLTAIDSFPEQINQASNENVLVANFSGTEEGVVEYAPDGTLVGVYDPTGLGGYRGVYELPNGNLLTTNGDGVFEIDRAGNLVDTKISGVNGRFIELVNLPFKVTATEPEANALHVAIGSPVSLTFSSQVISGTIGLTTLPVWGSLTGLHTGTYSLPAGNQAQFEADADFKPGETVMVVASSDISSTGGISLTPHAWQFWTATEGGSGVLAAHPVTPSFGAGTSFGATLGDLDSDGDLDAFMAHVNWPEPVWLNDGAGGFALHPTSFTTGSSLDVALGDLDGDGDLDAVAANLNQAQTVWLNDGLGAFTAHPITPTFGGYQSNDIDLGDLDGDGDLDAIVANQASAPQTVWLNDGAGGFSPHPTTPTFGAGESRSLALGDLDGDGDLDAVVANDAGQAETTWLNDGGGTFTAHPITPTFGVDKSREIVLGDLDGDGDLDAVVANYDAPGTGQANTVWLNDGDGGFSDSGQLLGDKNSVGLALGDLDGDGDLDAVVANTYVETNTVWLNDGAGTFSLPPTFPGFDLQDGTGVALGDLDGDGDLDVLIANDNGQPETVWLNQNQADLAILKTAEPASVPPGGLITYTLSFTNSGQLTATGVLITDILPAEIDQVLNLTHTGALITPTPGVTYAWQVQDLASGQAGRITLTAVLSQSLEAGPVSNSATITAAADANLSDNLSQAIVTVLNLPPLAGDDGGPGYVTDEDTPFVTADVLANDSDPNGDPLAVDSYDDSGLLGQLSYNGNGTFNYDPNGQLDDLAPGEQALELFSYVVSDIGGLTDTASVSLTVNGLNDPPTADDDPFTVTEDSLATPLDVLDGDSDPEGHSLTISDVGTPDQGGTAINGGDVVTYTPAPDFFGSETLTYTVTDDNGGFDTATVFVTVTNVNDPPQAGPDTADTPEDTPRTIAVLGNDNDPDDDPLTVIALGTPSHGSASSDGTTVTYTPSLNFVGSDTFNYTIGDPGGLTATAAITVNVGAINDPPQARPDTADTPEDTPGTIAVLDNDDDPDGDSLTVIALGAPAHGSASSDGTTVTYTPTLNFYGGDTFSYTISDGELTDTASVSLTVTPVNDPPTAQDDSYATPFDTPLSVDAPGLLANDQDPENDPLSAVLDTPPAGDLSLAPDGGFVYTPTAGFGGADTFSYHAHDGLADSNLATVTINVLSPDDADLALGKTVDDPTPSEGQAIVYTLQLQNDGPADATGVVASDPLPAGVTYVADDGGGLYEPVSGVWTVGDVPAGEGTTLHISATVDAGTAGTTLTNTAAISQSDQNDPLPGNDQASAAIQVTEAVCQPVTGVSLTPIITGTIRVGQALQFSADVSPDDATKPYTYTLDYGDGGIPITNTSSDDPLILTHTYTRTGRYTATIQVWNCAMSTPVTDTAQVLVETPTYHAYLPLVIRNATQASR